jgi:hypothetical protein
MISMSAVSPKDVSKRAKLADKRHSILGHFRSMLACTRKSRYIYLLLLGPSTKVQKCRRRFTVRTDIEQGPHRLVDIALKAIINSRFKPVTVRTAGLIDLSLDSFLPVYFHQMAPDSNEQIALSFNAAAIIEEVRAQVLPDNQRLAQIFLVMLMPKAKHKLTDFWTKPETFIRQLIPFLIRFPVVHDNMLKAVAADQRLSSQAGVCGIDFTEVIAKLGMSASPSASISFDTHLVLTSIFVFQVPCWIPGKWRKPESSPVTLRVKSSKINSATITARRIALFLFRPSTTDSPSWS